MRAVGRIKVTTYADVARERSGFWLTSLNLIHPDDVQDPIAALFSNIAQCTEHSQGLMTLLTSCYSERFTTSAPSNEAIKQLREEISGELRKASKMITACRNMLRLRADAYAAKVHAKELRQYGSWLPNLQYAQAKSYWDFVRFEQLENPALAVIPYGLVRVVEITSLLCQTNLTATDASIELFQHPATNTTAIQSMTPQALIDNEDIRCNVTVQIYNPQNTQQLSNKVRRAINKKNTSRWTTTPAGLFVRVITDGTADEWQAMPEGSRHSILDLIRKSSGAFVTGGSGQQ